MTQNVSIVIGLLCLLSISAMGMGLMLCLFQSRRDFGKRAASYGAVVFVFVLSFIIFQKPADAVGGSETQPIAVVNKPTALPTRSEVMGQLRIGSVSWSKSGFGVMSATFVIRNDSSVNVKDVEVTCRHSAKSGTIIDSNTRTVYEQIGRKSYASVVDMSMGFIHSEAVETKCTVVGYSTV